MAKNWKWEKPLLITPEGFDDKDTCIFPEKTGGKYVYLSPPESTIDPEDPLGAQGAPAGDPSKIVSKMADRAANNR